MIISAETEGPEGLEGGGGVIYLYFVEFTYSPFHRGLSGIFPLQPQATDGNLCLCVYWRLFTSHY